MEFAHFRQPPLKVSAFGVVAAQNQRLRAGSGGGITLVHPAEKIGARDVIGIKILHAFDTLQQS